MRQLGPILFRLLTGACFLTLVIATSWATEIPQIQVIDLGTTSAVPGIYSIKPFDPSKGTLDKVEVQIIGTATMTIGTIPHLVSCGPGGAVCPLPTPFTVELDANFGGLASRFFSFSNPALYFASGTTDGAGTPQVFVLPYSFDFSFTPTTDILGLTAPSVSGFQIPPTTIDGTRSSFETYLGGVYDLQDSFQVSSEQPGTAFPLAFSNSGTMQITYDYTLPTPPPSVPEPGSLLLMGSGAIALLSTVRRRARG
jgi:PEP-CTERM motif